MNAVHWFTQEAKAKQNRKRKLKKKMRKALAAEGRSSAAQSADPGPGMIPGSASAAGGAAAHPTSHSQQSTADAANERETHQHLPSAVQGSRPTVADRLRADTTQEVEADNMPGPSGISGAASAAQLPLPAAGPSATAKHHRVHPTPPAVAPGLHVPVARGGSAATAQKQQGKPAPGRQ